MNRWKAIDIQWDTNGEDVELPSEILIPEDMIDEDEISDYITNKTGFCHNGFAVDMGGSEFDLVVFNFETGDSSCPWWQEFALVNRKQFDYAKLEVVITRYFESDACEDYDHDECVKDILNASRWEWKAFPFYNGCEIYDVHTYWV